MDDDFCSLSQEGIRKEEICVAPLKEGKREEEI